jgi:hypothetical protein
MHARLRQRLLSLAVADRKRRVPRLRIPMFHQCRASHEQRNDTECSESPNQNDHRQKTHAHAIREERPSLTGEPARRQAPPPALHASALHGQNHVAETTASPAPSQPNDLDG